ncbi:MAG: DNA-binding protein, partial [Caulobacteraceae bacterium]|nr:DNA-binding protein [Caulobacteraceae bacterium]
AQYRRRGGARESILADFLIGAHAAVAGYALLTRDPRRVRAAFPGVELITPGAA